MSWPIRHYMFVGRRNDHGVEVFDVLWSGGGAGPDYFPDHVCTCPTKEKATEVVEALEASMLVEVPA